ncbi:MAG: TIGR00180 family glycosyltransferase [Caulobacter sp.]|nr:TIGR00180 family glycosyltransferase [Caulobacter sp.]
MITIFIPTMNRAGFVRRALEFYRRSGFKGTILFGDSSEGGQLVRMRMLVEAYSAAGMSIDYHHVPREVPIAQLHQKILGEVTTPYVTYAGDDDLQSPVGLAHAVVFLQKNPDFAGAKAALVETSIGRAAPHGEIEKIWLAQLPSYEDGAAVVRLQNYSRCALSLQYAVYRTEIMQRAYSVLRKPFQIYWTEEFLPCAMLAALGKTKYIPVLGTLWQYDGSGGVWKRHNMFELLSSPDWPHVLSHLTAALASLLVEKEAVSPDEAEETVRREIWWHAAMFMHHHWRTRYVEPEKRAESNAELFARLEDDSIFRIARDVYRGDDAFLPLPGWDQAGQ